MAVKDQIIAGSPTQNLNKPTKNMRIQVWVCPTPGCPDYYGVSGGSDLRQKFSGPKAENRAELAEKTGSKFTKSRADCPACFTRGQRVPRVPILIDVKVPIPEPGENTPVALPAH